MRSKYLLEPTSRVHGISAVIIITLTGQNIWTAKSPTSRKKIRAAAIHVYFMQSFSMSDSPAKIAIEPNGDGMLCGGTYELLSTGLVGHVGIAQSLFNQFRFRPRED